ncbi:FUSC family protein [Amycolatopsis viridis]|uniref:Integral membrane bound transporter domain-containing protein n=1 Tax=Amycolatopsis viridis TaxID=185678 RepID=A0ABX0SNG2_9PSEU|nr:FUSC family protein [Amycolatopsis viridis]NIH78507.1 hypothetical protein [Amycolatopsis viridis]
MTVVLPVFWSMGQLTTWWSPPVDAVVFAVMLALGLPRAIQAVPRDHLPVAAAGALAGVVIATGCGMLLSGTTAQVLLGAAAFAVTASAAVWLRRFGAAWRTASITAGVPFTAVLVHPLPLDRTWPVLGWMSVGGVVAVCWTLALTSPAATKAPARRSRQRLAPSTRQAVQLLGALAGAFVAGELLDPDHLVWPVLTVLLVSSGNRGRADVLRKGAQRMAGALGGTALATWATSSLAPGDNLAVVAVFGLLALAAGLRPFGYVFWAGGVTGALAFLYGFFGQGGTEVLAHRLIGIAAGSVLAVLAAWYVLPIRARGRSTGDNTTRDARADRTDSAA